MSCFEYKICMEYAGALKWDILIFQREVLVYRERSDWRCILSYEHATLEGHLAPGQALRAALRSLAA